MMSQRLLALAAGLAALSSWTSGAPNPKANSLPDVSFEIQTKKLTSLVDERFLSMSVDPEHLIRHAQPGPGALRMLTMVTAMSPAYLRVAGPSTEVMGFEGSPSHVGDTITVNDKHWNHFQNMCRTAGLRAIIALSSRRRPGGGLRWDSRDAMRILGAIDASSVAPAGWQLGYDWETLRKAGVTPGQAATDIRILKSLIEEFPTLAKEAQIILGPDADATNPDAEAAVELTKGANVGAVVIRPFTSDDPTGAKLDKDFVNKVLGRNPKRPLWIAESGGACTAPFSSALLWAQRLCTATRIGAQVILRELDLDAARENATPDFWVSLLHKTLTSRGILDARGSGVQAGDLSVSAHCTPSNRDESTKTSPISIRYDLGAVTVMAANPSNRTLTLSLEIARGNGIGSLAGSADNIRTVVHEYVLTAPNDDLNATSALLNGSPLELAHGGSIPVLSPRLLKLETPLKVSLPAKSVAFWVIPGAKARACLTPPASSDVAPAASRLQPISARGVEIGVHLDDHSPLLAEQENEEREHQDDLSEESEENPVARDLRRRRQRISARPSGVSRLSLPRAPTLPRRPSLDLNLGRSAKEPETKTLDDYIREELRRRPSRTRASEPFKLPTLSSLTSSLPTPSLPQLDLSALELPPLPTIPTLPQIDSTTMLDPLKLNSDLQKMNSDLQRNLVQQATTPIRNLVKMTDGLLDQIQSSPQADRKKRSVEDALTLDEDTETARFEMDDDPTRSKRKTVLDYMKEDLKKKNKKAPSEQDTKRSITRGEGHSRTRRFAPEDIGLRTKRKPAIPDFVSLPRLKKPLLPSAAAKRAQLLISQSNDEGGSPNSWGLTHREMFPHGDVYAETESPSDGRDPNVDYVSDDDYPEPADSKTPVSRSNTPAPERDAMHYAPGEFFETYANQGRVATRNPTIAGEFGELEHLPRQTSPPVLNQRRTSAGVPSRKEEFAGMGHVSGKIKPSFDDSDADSLKVVPAAKPNKEKEAKIQSELRKRLDEHYRDVQKAALDKKAEDGSDEEDAPDEKMDMDSLKALAERYRQEKKLKLPEKVQGNPNGLQKQAEPKQMETSDQKSRRRRDVGALETNRSEQAKHDESTEVVNPEVPSERKGLPIIKKAESESSHTAHEMRERRLEKIKAFREKMSSDHPHIPLKGKLGNDSQEHTTNRHKRGARYTDPFPSEGAFREIVRQIDREEKNNRPVPRDSTKSTQGFSGITKPKGEELWTFDPYGFPDPSPDTRSRTSFGVQDFGSPYSPSHDIYSPPPDYVPFRPEHSSRPSSYRPGSSYHRPGSSHHRPGFGSYPSHGSGSFPSHIDGSSEESCSSSEEAHSGHRHKGHYQSNGHFSRRTSDFDPDLDFPDDVYAQDFSPEVQDAPYQQSQSQRYPNIVAIPWETSFPSSVRYKRSVDPAVTNTIVQTDSKQQSEAEIAEAFRQLHKILNEDSLSSEEKSVEVNHERRLIDSPETVDSLEDTIQTLLNMTKSLNGTLNRGEEVLSWSEFGMNDTKPADPQLDPEEMKFRDAAVAWIQAAKTGAIQVAPKEKDESASSHHGSVKKDLPDGEEPSAPAKELARQQKLSEQENIVTAMMQQVSALLSQLRTILNKKEVDSDRA